MATIVTLPPRRITGATGARGAAAALALPHPPVGAAVAVTLPPKGFGYGRYVQASSDPVLLLSAGVKTGLTMTVDLTASRTTLSSPFQFAELWDGQLLRANHRDDLFSMRLNVSVTSMVSGGSIRLEADVIGGPTALTVTEALPDQAGETQTISFNSIIAASSGLLASGGATLWLTSTVPIPVSGLILLIAPQDSGA